MNARLRTWGSLLALVPGLLACDPPAPVPQGDSHTNWLRTCETSQDCGGLSCVCGVCTAPCEADAGCADAPGASCLPATHAGTVALCGGKRVEGRGLCLPPCDAQSCDLGQACVAGACQPQTAPSAEVAVDTSIQLQQLVGFGATVGYAEDEISAFSERAALDDAMFARLGLDVLRFRNRYGEVSDERLGQAAEIVNAATRSLGRRPLVLVSSWSPPAALKQNGATFCSYDATTCTLAKAANGSFDYAGLASHLRQSLEAYARAGFVADYLSIQNNPDWVPTGGAVFEACRFLATEGNLATLVNGVSVPVPYPGYRQALRAVIDALEDLPARPQLLAPELSGMVGAEPYLEQLDASQIGAVAHHMYGADATNLDVAALRSLAGLHDGMGLPLFQTEMQADGFDTAVLIHHALVDGGASMYLQTALVGPFAGPATNGSALIGLQADTFTLQDAYFAMSHYSRFTDPGWSRVAASGSATGLLTSAWLAPEGDRLSVILINSGGNTLSVDVKLDAQAPSAGQLLRSVFDGSERMAELGAWSRGATISLPARSIATLVLSD